MNAITINIFENAEQAIAGGFTYHNAPYKVCQISKMVIVLNGTVDGNSTVDIILEDDNGNKFVAVTTANLLTGVVNCCK